MTDTNGSRRKFLKLSATGAVVVVVAGVGAYYALQPQPSPTPMATPRPAPPPAPAATASPTPVAPKPSPTPSLIDKAKQEGSLLMYHPLLVEETVKMGEAFMKKYPGIKFEQVKGASELTERMLTEYRAGKHLMDVSIQSPGLILAALQEDMWSEYPLQSPEAAVYPPHLKDPKKRWVLIYDAPVGIAYNTSLVKPAEAPKTFADILKPEFKNAVGARHPDVYAYLYRGLEVAVGGDKYEDYLKRINEQNPRFTKSGGEDYTFLKTGEVKVNMLTYTSRIFDGIPKGDPVESVRIKGGLLSDPIMILMNKNAPHPNAARLFVDWILSQEGAQFVADMNIYVPLRPGVQSKIGAGKGTGKIITADDLIYYWPYTLENLRNAAEKAKRAFRT